MNYFLKPAKFWVDITKSNDVFFLIFIIINCKEKEIEKKERKVIQEREDLCKLSLKIIFQFYLCDKKKYNLLHICYIYSV